MRAMSPRRRAVTLLRDRRGANLVEYLLIVGVVALIAIAGFKVFGGKVWDKSEKQGESVDSINGAAK
jgi:pilus assembly protein Flp/PilA